MLEKSSTLVLTREELAQLEAGTIPNRIFQSWGLNLQDVSDIIRNKQYVLVDSNINTETTNTTK